MPEANAVLDELRNSPGRNGSGIEVDEYGLLPQQAKFIKFFMLRPNKTWAAKQAGYSPHSAAQQGCELFKHPKVAARVAELQAEENAKYAATKDNILSILARLAGFDARDIYNDDGTAKPMNELDRAAGLALTGVESAEMEVGGHDNSEGGEGAAPAAVVKVKKYRFAGRERALELMMKTLGMLKETSADKKDRLKEVIDALKAEWNTMESEAD